jgi:hypothetical protein
MRPVRNVFQKLSRTEQRREGVVAYLWAKCSGTNTGVFHSQACTFPEESFILSSPCNSVEEIYICDKKRIVSYYSYTVITRLS